MGDTHGRIWMPLDNAALIFPAIRRKNWNNVFRQSITLREDVDPALSLSLTVCFTGEFSGTISRRSRRRPPSRRTTPTP